MFDFYNVLHAVSVIIALSGQCPAEEPLCSALTPQSDASLVSLTWRDAGSLALRRGLSRAKLGGRTNSKASLNPASRAKGTESHLSLLCAITDNKGGQTFNDDCKTRGLLILEGRGRGTNIYTKTAG